MPFRSFISSEVFEKLKIYWSKKRSVNDRPRCPNPKRISGALVALAVSSATIGAGWGYAAPQSQPSQDAKKQPAPSRPAPLDIHLRVHSLGVDATYQDDPALRELIAPYKSDVLERIKEVIGSSEQPIEKGLAGGALGNLVADAMRAESERILKKRVDLAIQNSGGLRNPIPQGPITVETIFRLMPFENEIYILAMNGVQARQLLEFMATRMQNRGGDAQSGARLEVRAGKLVSAEIGDAPINPNALYTVAVSDYLYGGGSGYSMLAEIKQHTSLNLTLRDSIINFIRGETAAGRSLRPRLDGRIKLLDEPSGGKEPLTP